MPIGGGARATPPALLCMYTVLEGRAAAAAGPNSTSVSAMRALPGGTQSPVRASLGALFGFCPALLHGSRAVSRLLPRPTAQERRCSTAPSRGLVDEGACQSEDGVGTESVAPPGTTFALRRACIVRRDVFAFDAVVQSSAVVSRIRHVPYLVADEKGDGALVHSADVGARVADGQ